MNIHKNARLTVRSRAALVRRVLSEGQSRKAVAPAFGVAAKTVSKWVTVRYGDRNGIAAVAGGRCRCWPRHVPAGKANPHLRHLLGLGFDEQALSSGKGQHLQPARSEPRLLRVVLCSAR